MIISEHLIVRRGALLAINLRIMLVSLRASWCALGRAAFVEVLPRGTRI